MTFEDMQLFLNKTQQERTETKIMNALLACYQEVKNLEKVVIELGATNMKFQKWWSDMAQKYGWESAEGGNWEIDFDTCDIYLNA